MVGNGTNLQEVGWVSRFRLVVFDRSPHPVYGQQIFVSEASSPHRVWVSKDKSEREEGWTPRLDFWAFSHNVGDCVMISVGQATGPLRSKLEIGRRIGNAPEDAGWKEQFIFWVKYGSFA